MFTYSTWNLCRRIQALYCIIIKNSLTNWVLLATLCCIYSANDILFQEFSKNNSAQFLWSKVPYYRTNKKYRNCYILTCHRLWNVRSFNAKNSCLKKYTSWYNFFRECYNTQVALINFFFGTTLEECASVKIMICNRVAEFLCNRPESLKYDHRFGRLISQIPEEVLCTIWQLKMWSSWPEASF